MKNLSLIALMIALVCIAPSVDAQIKTPRPSPAAELEQVIGLTEVEISYSRPGVKERVIYGELVPFGEKWRTGANAVTSISFSTDAKIQGEDIAAGEYALLTTPGEEEWTFHFYPLEGSNWGAYAEKEASVEVTAKSSEMSFTMESMMFFFDNVKSSSATMGLAWEETAVFLQIEVPTDEIVLKKIDEVMAGPSARDYSAAADYHHGAGNDEKALEYIQMATAGENPNMWDVRTEAEIQASLGDYKAAVVAAERSNELAAASDSQWADYLTNLNNESIEEWKSAKKKK